MAKSMMELFREAGELDDRERATLAGLLLESLDAAPDPDAEAAWRTEIHRRLAQMDAGEVQPVAWKDVKRKLLPEAEPDR